jgi:UDP-N-acetyl-D-glucosamine 4,6-dehydratase
MKKRVLMDALTAWLMRPTALKRTLFFLLFDGILSALTLYFAYQLRFNFDVPMETYASFGRVFTTIFFLKVLALFGFKIYFVAWRFFGLNEAKNLFKAHLVAYGAFTLIFLLFSEFFLPFPRSLIIIDFFLSFTCIGALRIVKRILFETAATKVNPTLILGANHKATTIIKSFLNKELPYYPVAIIDLNDSNMVGTYLSGVKVYGSLYLEKLSDQNAVTAAIITEKLDPKELSQLYDALISLGIEDIKLAHLVSDKTEELKPVAIEDLLAREPKDLDATRIKNFIHGRSVLITGAGGSIGSELVRQCAGFGASKLILVDHSEFSLYSICEELHELKIPHEALLCSVTNDEKIDSIFNEHKPQIVLHAAAYKHVPLCEANPKEAIINNILGTKICIDAAIAHNVQKFILISTDKAVRPTNVMGATKRVCELYATNVDAKDCEIAAVRFGNVLGSSGSVIPKFKTQIENGGPITVTHPEITRYFMLIPEACQLVLQAASLAKRSETFILDMGEPVKIVDLAKRMLKLYGKSEIPIIFTGLRPGEKLYEELLIEQSDALTPYASITVARHSPYPIDKLNVLLKDLLQSNQPINILQQIVPEYTPYQQGN